MGEGVTEVWYFPGPEGDYVQVFTRRNDVEARYSYPAEDVRVIQDAASSDFGQPLLAYLRSIVAALPTKGGKPDPLQFPYEGLDKVHPDSVLGRLITGEPILEESDAAAVTPIYPFGSNLSQRSAVKNALRYSVSVIDGPPGTGKTHTIANLVGSLIAEPGLSIGVVSFNNAAVDNVRDKLAGGGFGFALANLGRREKRDEFFANQAARNAELQAYLGAATVDRPQIEQMQQIEQTLNAHQKQERELQRLRRELEALLLEQRHFERVIDGEDLPELDGVALLERTSDRILEFLAETQFPQEGNRLRKWVRHLRWLIKFGSLRGVDIDSTDSVLRLYRAYYERRSTELTNQIEHLEKACRDADLKQLIKTQGELSKAYLNEGLRRRYFARDTPEYDSRNYRRKMREFLTDYPVVLSTCHSLRNSLDEGRLLDYLVIDEASQLDLPTAALALASCRRVVIVGDLRQIPHIPNEDAAAQAGDAPHPAFDYLEHNVLSSLIEFYGEALPRTVLREHYRCDPAIIGFCNQKFYGGELISYSKIGTSQDALALNPTAPGNHMRQFRSGGRINRREIELIQDEVIPYLPAKYSREDIGVTTPYRRQANELSDSLNEDSGPIEADTVHRYQGREKPVIIMSTVLDETRQGRIGTRFVDDPHLVNVAVSRAVERFVLVTNNDLLPKSRHLRDLVGYIRYQNPERELPDSKVVSVFDLLYSKQSEKLSELARRIGGPSKFKSENIIWTVLKDILEDEAYLGLSVSPQILLQTVVPPSATLTADQAAYLKNRASLDFVVYNGVTKTPLLAIEVNGFAFHDNKPEQLRRDQLKAEILQQSGIPFLTLPTTGSSEYERIRDALDAALDTAVLIPMSEES
ncbi:AAA family ATPase [Leucobacter coleopterorum]|uniref:AAA family ATPase n=1 Tax=Leucobacter coleopterorum TaxID=2714933 RepID=A0ABX6JU24_9MICO|nr:AAA domain-containing protein [Leucobacter coleopterorum]QIM17733.1 AAA family ATPase [Leucobacter coleopterorum]